MNNTVRLSVGTAGAVGEALGCLVIILEHAVAVFLISRCRIIKKSVVILIKNLCVIDILTASWGFIRAIVRQNLMDSINLCKMDVLLTTWSFNVSAFFVTAVAVERYASIFWPIEYVNFVSKQKFVMVCWILWLCGFSVGFVTLLFEFSYSKEDGCDIRMSLTEVFPWCLVLLRLLCICIIGFSYGKIYFKIVSMGQMYNKSIKRGELRSLWKILLIVAPHLLLHLTYITLFFVKPFLAMPTRAISFESFLTTVVMFLDSFIYVFRFRECRTNILIYFCCCKREIREKNVWKRTLFYGPFLDDHKNNPRLDVLTHL